MKDSHQKSVSTREVFAVYWGEVCKHSWLFILVIFGLLGVQVFDLIAPLYLRDFFNILASSSGHTLPFMQFITPVIAVACLWLAGQVMWRIQTRSVITLQVRAMHNLSNHAFTNIIKHSHNFFSTNFSGTLTNRVMKFVGAFESLFDTVITQMIPIGFFLCGAVFMLSIRNHILGIIFGLWILAFLVLQLFVARWNQPKRKARTEIGSRVVGALSDAISNQGAIALFAGEKYEETLFTKLDSMWNHATLRAWYADDVVYGVQGFLMTTINIVLLIGAAILWRQGSVTIGDFVFIQTYLFGTFNRLNLTNRLLRSYYTAIADASEMVEILNTPYGVKDIPNAQTLTVSKGEIAFTDVSFYFHETRPILKHLNISIAGGQHVALVGPSGAGKSTIIKLLLRLYDAGNGSITIDGQNIAHVTQESLRTMIAFVPQEPALFHRSLMDNIRYGKRDASDKEVIEAAKKAHCHDFISALPDGYNTLVGERGIKLSGGERQRITIARAMLKNAPILILDEATSSLDSESEALIQDALETLMKEKTVVVIAHRLSTIMKMDRIIVLEDGAVVVDGNHDQLLTQGGLYQKLWSIQAGGFLQDEGDLKNS